MEMSNEFQDEIVETWRTQASKNYEYFAQVEKLTYVFWVENGAFRKLFDQLDRRRLIELACGQGRHTVLVPPGYESILAIDTSVDAISECRKRYGALSHVQFVLSKDGCSIPAPASSHTAIFSYDAMVHFEPLTINAYLSEASRVLTPGGRGLFHHSNYSGNPTGKFTDGLHWRNYMTRDLFAHFCSRSGLKVVQQVEMDWNDAPKLDCLTLFEKT
jgi:ubiquinone/menaquinone biosynthesis C-methylase UbiE